uniref:RIMS-binding protein 2 n=1 Tax=Geotrypetes seraphini TaxID=260995 RepID=A0A6P8PTX6_GEOSA|nr:peripheral-type benzodiazepine receptor-associated protein 1 isoform X3 [Geotrypetes seraphini]
MKKDSANSFRFSPKKSDSVLLDECKREIEQLKGDLESEKLRHHDIQRRFTLEVKELKETTEKEKHKLVNNLRSKYELQKSRDLKQLKDLLIREREVEIRQLLRWKDAELRELQSVLEKDREVVVRQARELQKQLTDELLNKGYAGKPGVLRRMSEPVRSVECHCKLQEVLSKLRWEFDGEQAAQIRHLKVELELERSLFLKYILEDSKCDFTALLKQSNTKSLRSGLRNVKLEHSSLDIITVRPHSLESMTSRPRSTEHVTSRPRSLDSIFAISECPDNVLIDATVTPECPDRCPQTESSGNLTEIDSPVNDTCNEESDQHLDSEFQLFETDVDNWNFQSSKSVHLLGKDFKAVEQTVSSQVAMAEFLGQQSHELSLLPPCSSALGENTRIVEEVCGRHLKKLSNDRFKTNSERKGCLPGTEEKVKRLKRKNAELAVIAKRLEERAKNLQEANLKMVNIPIHLENSSSEVYKKVFARQRARDLMEQASALLAKDKQIEALQQECQELQIKLSMGKPTSKKLHLSDFDHLLRESQKEVLRLQRQIAIKYHLRESFQISKAGSREPLPSTVVCTSIAVPGIHIDESTVTLAKPSFGNTAKEFELHKKRKECENLEQEVKKKHKRCEELETKLQEVQSENAHLVEANSQLTGKAKWTDKVESENADLRVQLINMTRERDSSIQEAHLLQSKLENLEQVLKHMREVIEHKQQLEKDHNEALIVLHGKQEEVKQLYQAQMEAKKEHEGAVLLLEARVRDLEEKCRCQKEQFSLLSQELKRFRLQKEKDHLISTPVTSELPATPCCSTPDQQERDMFSSWDIISWGDIDFLDESGSSFVNLSLESAKDARVFATSGEYKISEDETGREAIPKQPNSTYNVRKFPKDSLPTKENQTMKPEPMPNSSKSPQNSSKSSHSEVDTASEMEELDVDSTSPNPELEGQAPAKLQAFLARYSYNPFDGPNENPEVELPLTAGEYIYIYGEMDDDGFYEGELMDGRRGLVPSNFIEQVSDDDLMTFQPPEGNDLSHSSCQEISFLSESMSSMEKSDLLDEEETSLSPLLNCLQGEREESVDQEVVPYPRKPSLVKQLSRSIVVGWEPPLMPAGWGNVQSYNIYVDKELRQNVRFGSQSKALVEKLDLKKKTYRISVQCVTEKGNSDKLRCTFLVGFGFSIAPTDLRVRNISATSAEITWFPSNSNYTHAVYLNEEECAITKAGYYWYSFRNLMPNTQYNVKVESRPHKTPWELPPERREQKSTLIEFTTPSAGPPDAPLDVQVELGPSPEILLISWLPVTIDAAGTSNGVRVTGYAVYTDGQKVLEVTSPTAGSVLVGMAHLKLLQLSREVSVRTMSPYGESVDSVPAQIPSAFMNVSNCYSQVLVSSSLSYELPCGESSNFQAERIPSTPLTSSLNLLHNVPTAISNAKFSVNTTSNCDMSVDSMSVKVLSHLIPSLSASIVHSPDIANLMSHTLGHDLKDGCRMSIQGSTASSLPPEPDFSTKPYEEMALPKITSERDSKKQETVSQEEISSKGNWQLNSLDHTHSSDLSDILEEEEEEDLNVEMQKVKKLEQQDREGKMGVSEGPRLNQHPSPSVWHASTRKIRSKQASGDNKSEQRQSINNEELNTSRTMVASFDYNPRKDSPNLDVEAELTFNAGDVITVFGDMDDDGFFFGELNGHRGFIPSNFLEATCLDGKVLMGTLPENRETHEAREEAQLRFMHSGNLNESSPNLSDEPSLLSPSQDLKVTQPSERLKTVDMATRKKGFFFKGKKLFKKLGSSKKE